MTKLWERQIAHVDRRIGPLEWRCLRHDLRKAALRRRRGLPSRCKSLEATFEWVKLKALTRMGAQSTPHAALKLEWLALRERMLERKRTAREAARRRTKRNVLDTKINVWRRRQEWLRSLSMT